MAEKPNPYVNAVDELLKATNSTVSLILCKSTDKTIAEWPEKDINKPFRESTYKLEEVVRELEQKKGDARK